MKKIKRFFKTVLPAALATIIMAVPARADNLSNSTVGAGIRNILNDVSSFGIVLCPIVGGAAAVYFLIRRSMADEQDGKMWMRRIWMAIICGVAGCLVSGVIALISSYF